MLSMKTQQPRRRHPGKIEVYDGATNKLVKTLDATKLADSVRYAPTKDGLVAVTRVITHDTGKTVQIRELGADGQLLRSTTQLKKQ